MAIRSLPKIDASLALMHLDGLSYSQMSEVTGLSENYVGVKLTRIRKQLFEALNEQDETSEHSRSSSNNPFAELRSAPVTPGNEGGVS